MEDTVLILVGLLEQVDLVLIIANSLKDPGDTLRLVIVDEPEEEGAPIVVDIRGEEVDPASLDEGDDAVTVLVVGGSDELQAKRVGAEQGFDIGETFANGKVKGGVALGVFGKGGGIVNEEAKRSQVAVDGRQVEGGLALLVCLERRMEDLQF